MSYAPTRVGVAALSSVAGGGRHANHYDLDGAVLVCYSGASPYPDLRRLPVQKTMTRIYAMLQAVLVEQGKEGTQDGRFLPYVAQLATVRTHLLNGEGEAVYRAMNRFMEMLQAREAGISAEAADRLFDNCYLVTPARYHDVSRQLPRLSGHQAGAPSA